MRGIALMVMRSLRQHALSTIVTALSVALACGLLMAVFSIKAQTYNAFTSSSGGFDAVLGARGSELQLVLNSIYHMETSTGNLPWKLYQEIAANPMVEEAIPIAVGDNYKSYRIVGTPGSFWKHEYAPGKKFEVEPGGRFFDEKFREAVIGSFAAKRLELKVGDQVQTYHGVIYDEKQKHDVQFVVTGILKPTNTPADRVIWIPLEGYFRMGGHALYGTGEKYVPKAGVAIPEEAKEVSAVMLKFIKPSLGAQLSQTVNKQGKVATLAWPIGRIMADLFDKMGWMERVLTLVAYLVVLVAGGTILASIYNSMNERRREFAILRALGARRMTVFSAIVCEAAAIALLGTLIGYVIYGVLVAGAGVIIRAQTGVVLDVMQFHPVLVLTPIGMTLLGAIAGMVPAFKAYATDVASHLIPVS